MKRYLLLLFIFIFVSNSVADIEAEMLVKDITFSSVAETSVPPVLDGKLDELCWNNAKELASFVLTAGEHGETAKHETKVKLLFDQSFLYVAFYCLEPDINAMKTISLQTDDLDILYDDRVEVFLDINHDHRSYFELAVNSAGVQFDQSCFNQLHGSKTCDMDKSWNGFWRAKTAVYEDHWVAEIAIDVKSLGADALKPGITWGANFARVRQPDINRGEEFFKREPAGEAEYSAWAPVNDFIRETISNFQAPVEFGDIVFGNTDIIVKSFSFRSALYEFGPVGTPSWFGNNPLIIQADPINGKRDVLLKVSVEADGVKSWTNEKPVTLVPGLELKTGYFATTNLDNRIVVQFLDPVNKKQLYRTSYIEQVPPFIEFNLYSLYTRDPETLEPVSFRLLTDDKTRTNSQLELKLLEKNTAKVLYTESFRDLSKSADFLPVFDTAKLRNLPGGNYQIDCVLSDMSGNKVAGFVQNFTKFSPDLPAAFIAEEGDYSYGGITGHGIRIRYPFPAEFVFWRHGSYIPIWECEQAAMTNEFIECWGGGNQGCCEPMQDRECRYSRVELLENSDVRAVVHWRYALSDPHYKIYKNEWVDEYYILYPDGVGVRQVNLWPNSNTRHEMFEVLLVKPPMVHTDQMYDNEFATLTGLMGERHSNKEFTGNKKAYKTFLASDNDFIINVHFKDRMHPFTVFSFRDDLLPGVTRDHVTAISKEMASADQRGHWPASRYQIDGYNTVGLDVPNHGNIGNIQAEIDPQNQPQTWTFLIGVKEKNSDLDKKQARSWLYPADVQVKTKGVEYSGYDESQRAYVLKTDQYKKSIELVLDAVKDKVINPVFIINNPHAGIKAVQLDKKKLNTSVLKTGKSKNNETLIFLNQELTGKHNLKITYEH